jgi:hypothetical protein
VESRVFQDINKRIRLLLAGILCVVTTYSQNESFPFQNGEELNYDIHYKYGLVMLKAGSARYRIQTANYGKQAAFRSSLDFKTTSFFDKIYKIRDTLTSYISTPQLIPLYNSRIVNEGDTHYTEKLFIRKSGAAYSEVRVLREKRKEIKVDTILSANNAGYDLLNIFIFVRALDYSQLNSENPIMTTTFLGQNKVNIIIRYQGQSVIEKGSNTKYKALKFSIDIADEVFNTSKNSMEVWISDDKNRLPIKLKAKLKIGAAEADLSSYKNLKHPFDAEIKLKSRQ